MEKRVMNAEKAIINFLFDLGILPNIKGYEYIKEAFKIIVDSKKQKTQMGITTYLYPTLEKKFGERTSRIEKAIRYAIIQAHKKNKEQMATIVPQWGNHRPTNSEFLTTIAEIYLMKM